jgi:hypothetical protein
MRRSFPYAGSIFAAAIGVSLLILPMDVGADTHWRTLATTSDHGNVCLSVEGQPLSYKRLDADDPVVVRVRGPRRVKILVRQLYEDDETGRQTYTLQVALDGEELLSRTYRGLPDAGVVPCADVNAGAGDLHRAYVTIPKGWHDLEVTARATTGGGVAARFFRESKRASANLVTYAPERYTGVTTLEFGTGKTSTYYTFTPEQPLVCEVTGPTTLTIWTRLDFNHTMIESQPYVLEVLCDNEPWRTFHYEVKKLKAAAYIDRPDVLPGERKTLKIPLDKGRHRVEIRCVRPSGCCVTAKIRIPAKDVR